MSLVVRFLTMNTSTAKMLISLMTANRIAICYLILYSVGLIVFAPIIHPIEEIDNAERDGYVQAADTIYRGGLPHDKYRPLLYPLLAAGVRHASPFDSFRSAQVVTILASIALLWMMYFISKRFLSDYPALLCTVLLSLNFVYIYNAVLTTTDMLFSALSLATLYAALRHNEKPGFASACLLGSLFALAFFTRYTAIFLAAPIAIAVCFTPTFRVKESAKYGTAFVVAMLLCLVPHFVLTYVQFGQILYTENIRNVAWKIGDEDYYAWPYYSQLPYDEILDILRARYRLVFIYGFDSIKQIIDASFRFISAPSSWARFIIVDLGLLLGLIAILAERKWKLVIVLVALTSYTVLIGLTFFPYPRIMLPTVPLIYILSFYGLQQIFSRFISVESIRRYYISLGLVLVLLFGLYLPGSLARFWWRHPIAEVNAIQALSQKVGPSAHIMATIPEAWRHVSGEFTYMPDLNVRIADPGSEPEYQLEAFMEFLYKLCKEEQIDYIVYGNVSRRNRPEQLLHATDVPSWLTAIETNRLFVVYQVNIVNE